MCGIGGCLDFNRPTPSGVLAAMARALGRRGPDSQGVFTDGPCGLAHARLSIIDVEGSPQPMTAAESGMTIVYNGEVYNYRELRNQLRALGEPLHTRGDTEALLRWLGREWIDALPRFNAMFAFAVWDKRRERLLLARDAIGEKPLFYATPEPGVLVFGSEVKAVLEHPAVTRTLDEDALRQALRFRAVYGEATLHRGVRQLEPGTWLEFSRAGLTQGRFFDLVEATRSAEVDLRGLSERELTARGRDLFLQSVEQRLVADVPVGAFLSGGLDSSLIVAAMRKAQPPSAEIRTFSVGFADDPHSELPFAGQVAELVGAVHTPIEVGPQAYVDRLAELSVCRDGPVSQPADVAIAEMSRVARAHVKVALSGEGADEVFGGYPKYGFAAAPALLQKVIGLVGAENTARIAGLLGVDRRRTLVAARALSQPREVDRNVQWFSYFDRGQLRDLLPGLGWTQADWEATAACHAAVLERLRGGSALQRMQMADCLTWLPGNMLERGDRMTMAEGLEVRPPFLNKSLCAFGLALPDRMKVSGRVGKRIVREWAAELLPKEILERRKWGFRTPLKGWFAGPLRGFLMDHVTNSAGVGATYGDVNAIRRLADRHVRGEIDASETLWSLLAVEVWYQNVYLPRTQNSSLRAAS